MAAKPGPKDRTVTIDGVELRLAQPDEMPVLSVGAETAKNQLRACWLVPGGSAADIGITDPLREVASTGEGASAPTRSYTDLKRAAVLSPSAEPDRLLTPLSSPESTSPTTTSWRSTIRSAWR